MIVLNEKQYAYRLLAHHDDPHIDISSFLIYTARLLPEFGFDDKEMYESLELELNNMEKTAQASGIKQRIKKAMTRAKAMGHLYPSKVIQFTNKEFERLYQIPIMSTRRIAFALMVFYKAMGEFYACGKDIREHTGMLPSGKVLNDSIRYIVSEGLFDVKEKVVRQDSNIRRVFYVPTPYLISLFDENDIALTISNYNNIANYLDWYDEPECYAVCEKCGSFIRKKRNYGPICKTCLEDEENKKKVENIIEDYKSYLF